MRRRCGEKTDSIVCGPESSMQGLLGCMESKPEKSCTRQILKPTSVADLHHIVVYEAFVSGAVLGLRACSSADL